jgi:hypothetical protein
MDDVIGIISGVADIVIGSGLIVLAVAFVKHLRDHNGT